MSVVNNEPIGLSHRSDGVILGDTPYSLFFDVEAPSLLAYDWSVGGGVAAQFTIVAGTQADRRTLHSAREASANGHLRLDEGPVTVMWRCDPSVFAPFFATRAVLQYHLVLSADRQVTARQQDMALLERRRVELQAAVAHEANFHTILEAEWKAADERARQETHRPVPPRPIFVVQHAAAALAGASGDGREDASDRAARFKACGGTGAVRSLLRGAGRDSRRAC